MNNISLIYSVKVVNCRIYYYLCSTMAKPIRNTPILSGRDAKAFRHEISQLPSADERRRERERIVASVEQLKSMIASLPR